MASEDFDRNEAATPYKLQKAKEKGQVAKSADVVSALVFGAAVVYLSWHGVDAALEQFKFDQALLRQFGRSTASADMLWPLISASVVATMVWLAPLLVVIVLAAMAGNLLQTGPILAIEPLAIDMDRLNPVTGLKKVFSMRTLFDGARACVKLVLLSLVAYFALVELAPQFYSLSSLPAMGYLHLLVADMASLSLKMAALLAVIAVVDLVFSRREFAKKMRMSKRELKDEHKQRDGDPRIKARIRELQREARKRSQSLRKAQTADVVLTNPTHVAVALRYVHGQMDSPQVVAKGAGHLAVLIRHIAAKNRIPVVRSPGLARKLFQDLEVDHHVPPQMFAEVARIIVWVFAMRERQSAGMRGTA